MTPLDRFLPDYEFRETHSRVVVADTSALMRAAAHYSPEDDWFFRLMIRLRELPARAICRFRPSPSPMPPAFGLHRFTILEHEPQRSLVYGLAGRFWRLDFGLFPIADTKAFDTFELPGTAKLALGIWAEEVGHQRTRLITETRIRCADNSAYRHLLPYWCVIRPFSGIIRGRILHAIARAATAVPGKQAD